MTHIGGFAGGTYPRAHSLTTGDCVCSGSPSWFRLTIGWDSSSAFYATHLGSLAKEGKLPEPYFINGDAAFRPGSQSMITPGPATSAWDDFNYVQSSTRVPIECAFGMIPLVTSSDLLAIDVALDFRNFAHALWRIVARTGT